MSTKQDSEPNIGWTEALGENVDNPLLPRTDGDTLFMPNGDEYTVSPLEQRIKAQYEKWVRRNAARAITEDAELGPDFVRTMSSTYCADRAAGKYNWGGSAIRASLNDTNGLKYLFYLLLYRGNKGMSYDKASALFEEVTEQAIVLIGWAMGNATSPNTKTAAGEVESTNHQQQKKTKKAMKIVEEQEATLDADMAH